MLADALAGGSSPIIPLLDFAPQLVIEGSAVIHPELKFFSVQGASGISSSLLPLR